MQINDFRRTPNEPRTNSERTPTNSKLSVQHRSTKKVFQVFARENQLELRGIHAQNQQNVDDFDNFEPIWHEKTQILYQFQLIFSSKNA